MQCPTCQSHHVQRCAVAYEQGTSTTTTRSTGSISAPGQVQHAVQETRQSTQRTAFAERIAPPANPIWAPLKGLLGAVVLLVGLNLLDSVIPLPTWIGVGVIAVIVFCAAWGVFAFLRLPGYRARHDLWGKSWVCADCGRTFLPET